MKYEIYYSCCSHVGKRRNTNQDNCFCDGKYMNDLREHMTFSMRGCPKHIPPLVFAVFDGMGGEECGEIASLIAAKCATELKTGSKPIEDLQRYCETANEEICRYANNNKIGSMGTTAVILVFAKNEINLCNIGDSKAFRFDGEKLEQISVDHYAVASYERKPPLSQNLGIPTTEMLIEPYYARGSYHDNDVYLLCSDGLTDMVSEEEIRKILVDAYVSKAADKSQTAEESKAIDRSEISDVNYAVDRLLQKALVNGGSDNISIILCKVKKKRGLLSRAFHAMFS